MVQRVVHLDVHRTALVAALCGAVVSLIVLVLALPMFLALPASSGTSGFGLIGGGFMAVIMPVMYFVIGYLATALSVVVFNFVAPRVGGIPVQFLAEGEGTL